MSTPAFPEMDELLQRLLNDEARPEEIERLRQAIIEDPEVRDYYIDSMSVCAVIRRSSQVTGEICDSELIEALSGNESQDRSRPMTRYLYAAAAMIALAAVIFASLPFLRPQAQSSGIGQLVGAYGAQWQGPGPNPGEPLHAGRYDLLEGVAEMELGPGTHLLVEAPCLFEVVSDSEIMLNAGRLAAVVSPQAKGFQVRTSTAIITDPGTEFGVIAYSDGRTEAHALQGSISVAANSHGSRKSTPLVITEHHAAMVDASGRFVREGLTAQADRFILRLPSGSLKTDLAGQLNLADIVGGGNGRGTGRLDWGIELRTGQAFRYPATEIRAVRRNEFHPATPFRGVDGVFVPNGAAGPVVISSTGLVFSECPSTAGSYHSSPSNTGKFFDIPSRRTYTARLNGIQFGTAGHPALNLHPNAGITFDLDQIRQDNPEIQIDRFSAICGIPKGLPQPQFSPAEVWVLLDGVVCFHLDYPVRQSSVKDVDVPIPPGARFLTLVTTCSGDADYSWILLGDPLLGPAVIE